MNMLKEFVMENAEIIDNLEWRKLADKIQDSGIRYSSNSKAD